jgi:outer membrane protein TolC
LLGGITQAQAALLGEVLKVTEVGYQGSKNTQTDVVAAQLSYTTAMQQVDVYRLNVENDRTQLDMLLYRRPDEPLVVDDKLDEKPIVVPVCGELQILGEISNSPHTGCRSRRSA